MIPSLGDPSSACPTNRTPATQAEHHYASRTAALNCAFQRITAITPDDRRSSPRQDRTPPARLMKTLCLQPKNAAGKTCYPLPLPDPSRPLWLSRPVPEVPWTPMTGYGVATLIGDFDGLVRCHLRKTESFFSVAIRHRPRAGPAHRHPAAVAVATAASCPRSGRCPTAGPARPFRGITWQPTRTPGTAPGTRPRTQASNNAHARAVSRPGRRDAGAVLGATAGAWLG
jgi:hypothetical protein